MSVYKPRASSETYWIEFQLGGERFRQDSGCTSKRAAEAAEKDARAAAKAALARNAEIARQFRGGEMPIGAAAGRYMLDFGRHLADADNQEKYLAAIVARLGPDMLLSAIDDGEVARLVSARRAEQIQRGANRAEGKVQSYAPRPVTAATVNRTVLAPLRQVLNKARKMWKVRTGEVDWGSHWLKEAEERKREASIGEEGAIMGELERGYDDAISFAFATGARLAEVVTLTWAKVNFFAHELQLTGKGDKTRTVPMTAALEALLKRQRGRHAEYVFTFAARATRPAQGLERGKRYPITYWGLQSAMRRGVDRAGVADFHMHDTRHTKATRVVRATGNLRVAKELLGHADIKTTMRYAHVTNDDIRRAMEASEIPTAGIGAETPQQTPQQPAAAARKSLKLVRQSA